MTTKLRLDQLLHQRGLAPSREKGRRMILAGEVTVEGRLIDKVATPVDVDAEITLRAKPAFVGRGGLKLERALEQFGIDPQGMVAADVGASTGGFTDCMLQRGATRVYAIDVGYGQLDYRLRQDPRVVVMERVNARHLEALTEPVDLVVIDVSFISLELILPRVAQWLGPGGQVVMLIKPQFEAGQELVGKGGIVRDHMTHRLVLQRVLSWAGEHGWRLHGLILSPVKGAKGNIEFLAWISRTDGAPAITLEDAIACVMDQATDTNI